jgi:signal transduction histidine kinase
VYRYRLVSSPIQRQQTKWVVFGVALAIGGFLFTALAVGAPIDLAPEQVGRRLLGQALVQGFVLLVPLSLGVAVLRRRLWDIDPVINRTLVYGALTAAVVGTYVFVVGYLGTLFSRGGGLAISLVAAGVVAVLFQPLRMRLQQGANRLMYGERDDPYAVLTRFGRRLESTLAPETVLPTIVHTVKEALKLPYVAITLADGRERGATAPAAAAGMPGEVALRLPLVYQHEPVGELLLAPRGPGEPFGPADRRLLADLARQAGVAVHAVRLSADLQRSRERLVSAREEERRRLRRDLHDGLGPALASMTLQTEAARDLYAADSARGDALLADLTEQLQAATADIRRLVYELRPPALDELGLVGALRAQATRHELGRTRIDILAPEALPPLPAAVEVAAYRIAQEALTNVLRHAEAETCTVTLAYDRTGVLTVDIADDGRGLPDGARAGVGMASMRERAEELGGACAIESSPIDGTRVRATLPCPPPDPVVQP